MYGTGYLNFLYIKKILYVLVERYCSTLVPHQDGLCLMPTRDLGIYRLG
jgi:hypothetical protein